MYKACIAGCGRIGFGFDEDPKRKYPATHAAAYKKVDGVELAAVCDLDRKLADKCADKWGVPGRYTDLGEMIAKEDPHILSICTPPETHFPILQRALKGGSIKAVFCEKPLAVTSEEAYEMASLCKESGVVLQVGHQRRFDPLHAEIRESVVKGSFGGLQQANFYYTAGIKNTGSHMFDILRFFFGDVEWVEAFLSKNPSRKDNDPNLDGILKFKKGHLVTFQACDVNNYLIFELNCFFDRARLVLKDSGFKLDFYEVRDSEHYSGYKELFKTASPFDDAYQRNFMVNAVKHIIGCVEKGSASVSSGEDGAKAVELIESSIMSADNNGKRVFLSRRR